MRDKYSREEVAQLFEKVSEEPPSFTAAELREVGERAGFSPEQLEASAERLEREQNRRRHLQISAGVLVVVFATVLFGPSIAGTNTRVLPIHNEHRSIGFDLEVLVPSVAARDCNVAPDLRHDAETYCVLRKQNLRPYDRTRLGLPAAKDACSQAWVRILSEGRLYDSQVFALPANIEIQRNGTLDQKGLGAPNMYSPPHHLNAQNFADCGGEHE